jgi:hypothetical protein
MFSAFFYLIWGSTCLFIGLTGKGLRPQSGAEGKVKLVRKILTFCGAALLLGSAWEFFDLFFSKQ